MTTAFVLSGGGSLGAVQVGMLQALAARGVEPDLVIGTSAGALNAAYVAGYGTSPEALDDLTELTDLRVLPPLCPLSVSSTDFRHGALLIERARTATERWLDEGGPRLSHPERFLSLHRHRLDIHTCHGDEAA